MGGMHCTRQLPSSFNQSQNQAGKETSVILNVYHIGDSRTGTLGINTLLRPFGTGAFHCGVEVHDWEWSYSDIMGSVAMPEMSGVFSCTPRCCEGHSFFTSIPMGVVRVSASEVLALIEEMEQQWTIEVYDILRHNCCHFCQALCARLGVGPVPDWVTSLAGYGESLFSLSDSFSEMFCCRTVRNRCSDRGGAPEEYLEQEAFAVLGKGHWTFQEPSSELVIPGGGVAGGASSTTAALAVAKVVAEPAASASAPPRDGCRGSSDGHRWIATAATSGQAPQTKSTSDGISRWSGALYNDADVLPPDVLASI